jgi:Transcription initiation factor IIA, gamma subunit
MKVLSQFDRVIAETLSEKVKARLTFKVITTRVAVLLLLWGRVMSTSSRDALQPTLLDNLSTRFKASKANVMSVFFSRIVGIARYISLLR